MPRPCLPTQTRLHRPRRAVLAAALWAMASAVPGCAGGEAGPGDADGDASPAPGDPVPAGYYVLGQDERDALSDCAASALYRQRLQVPAALLSDADSEFGNTHLDLLADGALASVGYRRVVFTPVECPSGACQAIRFHLVFDAGRAFCVVYHPAGATHDFKKGDGLGGSLPFTAADRARLNEILQSPAADLDAVTDQAALVIGVSETAPTRPEYVGDVVAGAAFTTWLVLKFMEQTREILAVFP